MRIGSLFSGIGGLELGLEWAGLGRTVWQVEKDPFCRRVLAKHWPDAERFEDVTEIGGAQLSHVDVLCGGFPCQDVSSAGKRAGLSGARSGLWYDYLRIVQELCPAIVIVENVASGKKLWLPDVRRGLCDSGYASCAFSLSAADVGAPHLRRRVFVVAYSNGLFVREQRRRGRGKEGSGAALARIDGASGAPADAMRFTKDLEHKERGDVRGAWNGGRDGRAPVSAIRGVDDGLSGRLDAARKRALGNAVVPQCAEVIGRMIVEGWA